jgi:hypothetical protein
METVPAPIGTPGTPTVVAAPTRSLWQTDAIGLKVRWPVSWALRDPRGFAWLTPTAW